MKEKWYIPKGYVFMEDQKIKITKSFAVKGDNLKKACEDAKKILKESGVKNYLFTLTEAKDIGAIHK
jgi:hypothetical protein